MGEAGKIDCFGMFDILGLWATPARRECSVAFGLKNIPVGEIQISFWLRVAGKKAQRIGFGNLKTKAPGHSQILANRIRLAVEQFGTHQIGVAVGNVLSGKNALWIPLLVRELPWPSLPTGQELEKRLSDPHSIKSGRAVLKCEKCKTEYIFQINLDPEAPMPDGSLPFPGDGLFVCPSCRTTHHLKDVEGLVRSQLGKPERESGVGK